MSRAFWFTKKGAKNVNPNPEVGEEETASFCEGSVLDFGCGFGRMATALCTHRALALGSWYLGVDIVPQRIQAVHKTHTPAHFQVIDSHFDLLGLSQFDTVLARSVLQHVEDDEIEDTLVSLTTAARTAVVVCEHLGREKWGKASFSYNRDFEAYDDILRSLGFDLSKRLEIPNPRYNNEPASLLQWTRHG